MHPSGGRGGAGDKGLAKAEYKVGVVEPQFPEGKISKAKHHLGLRNVPGTVQRQSLYDQGQGADFTMPLD